MLTSSDGGLNTGNRLQPTDYFECKRRGSSRRHQSWMVEMEQAAAMPKDIVFNGECGASSKGRQWSCSREFRHRGDHMAADTEQSILVAVWSQDGDLAKPEAKPVVEKYTLKDRFEYPQADVQKMPVWPGQYEDPSEICKERSPRMNWSCTGGIHSGPHVHKQGANEEEMAVSFVYAIWDTATGDE